MTLSSQLLSTLAPLGRIRASINTGNPILARLQADGQPAGVSIDLARRLAQQLEAEAARLPGLRLLPVRFMVIQQAMGLPTGRGDEALRVLAAFVEEAKASGFVAEALRRHGIQGAAVAPAA
jgi:ABC-type amino acid transport substrate-binding protein